MQYALYRPPAPGAGTSLPSRSIYARSHAPSDIGSGVESRLPTVEPAGAKPTEGGFRKVRGEDDMNEETQSNPDDEMIGSLGSLEPSVDDFVSDLLLQQLGSSGRKYKRESRKAHRAIVSDIYSPPRITRQPKEHPRKHPL